MRSDGAHEWLRIDADAEIARIAEAIQTQVRFSLFRSGVVLGLSGGIDSTVTAALCVRALGPDAVIGISMPERDSDRETEDLGTVAANHLGIRTFAEDITGTLEACGCYRRQETAISGAIPDFQPGTPFKLVTPGILREEDADDYRLAFPGPDGTLREEPLPLEALRALVAATNFKQRVRKMLEYYYADRFQYAVAGTPNRLEYDLGFFVRNGDGAADIKPIAHLYKSQVYALAERMNLPESIVTRPPTTDTFPLPQSQEEFFFGLPLELLDLCLFCRNEKISVAQTAEAANLSEKQVRTIFGDLAAKRALAEYLLAPPLCVGD